MLTPIETTCVVDENGRKANIASALSRGLPDCKKLPARQGKLAIVGSGPSVKDHLVELREWDGRIWAINGAFDYLRFNTGRVPDGFVALDPLPIMVDFIPTPPPRGVTYFIASACHPDLFDALKGRDVRIWHSNGACNDALPSGSFAVPGGITCITRAPFLAYLLGWQDITIFGADCSYSEVSTHVYESGTYRGDTTTNAVLTVKVNGKNFLTEAGLLHQAANLGYIETMFPAKLTFKCGGLLKAFLESPMRDYSEFESAA